MGYKTLLNYFLTHLTKNRRGIIAFFKFFYFVIIIVLLIGTLFYHNRSYFPFLYSSARLSGKIALIFYILTVLPGIFRRFNLKPRIILPLQSFRRYIGIAMFLLVSLHFWFIYGIKIITKGLPKSSPLFISFGLIAFLLTLPLFLTSNNFSVNKLKKWWSKIHQLTYLIIFFIFLHLVLQQINFWSALIILTLILQLISHLYFLFFPQKF